MTNKELRDYLQTLPDELNVKIFDGKNAKEFTDDQIIISADTAFVDDEAPEDEWDCEDGKIELGDGEKYILLNALII